MVRRVKTVLVEQYLRFVDLSGHSVYRDIGEVDKVVAFVRACASDRQPAEALGKTGLLFAREIVYRDLGHVASALYPAGQTWRNSEEQVESRAPGAD